jgi:NADPH-dependent F420 reductase
MRIAVIGAGSVGSSLGARWAQAGHEIMFGVRDPQSDNTQKALARAGERAQAGSLADAAAFGEVIVLAVPWQAVPYAVSDLGDIGGKILVDATNRIAPASAGEAASGAETIAALATNAHVVKAFNTMGAETMYNPTINDKPVTAFVCGDHAAAKATVIQLAQDIGLDAVDAGLLSNAVNVEAVAKLWISMARAGMGRRFGFHLLRE